jgi:hypothetical protein
VRVSKVAARLAAVAVVTATVVAVDAIVAAPAATVADQPRAKEQEDGKAGSREEGF